MLILSKIVRRDRDFPPLAGLIPPEAGRTLDQFVKSVAAFESLNLLFPVFGIF